MRKMIGKGRVVVAAVLLCTTLLATVPARAADVAPYEDQDSNVLKVAYYFVYPIGKAAEFLIFRPLHTISALTQPDPDEIAATAGDDLSHCLSYRPSRSCGRRGQ